METEFRGRDNGAIENLESIVQDPKHSLEIYLGQKEMQKLGQSWFVIDVSYNKNNDFAVALCSTKISKKEFKELNDREVIEKVGDRRTAIILNSSSLGSCNFRVISTVQ